MSDSNSSMAVHFSSATDEWATPQAFFDRLAVEFEGFDLDPCCLPSSAKAPQYYTPETDGLTSPWFGKVFLNPPYGRAIGAWTARARESVESGSASLVVGLLPARTDTLWWHRDVMAAEEIRLVRRRLRFGEATVGAPFPSAVAIWRAHDLDVPRLATMSAN